jgi:hypothetical protein
MALCIRRSHSKAQEHLLFLRWYLFKTYRDILFMEASYILHRLYCPRPGINEETFAWAPEASDQSAVYTTIEMERFGSQAVLVKFDRLEKMYPLTAAAGCDVIIM